MVQVNTNTSLAVESPQGRKIFIFDRVFAEEVTQHAVWDYLQDSVDSFLQGLQCFTTSLRSVWLRQELPLWEHQALRNNSTLR